MRRDGQATVEYAVPRSLACPQFRGQRVNVGHYSSNMIGLRLPLVECRRLGL